MQPSFIAHPNHYTLQEFARALRRYSDAQWRPSFPTLHNTGVPSLAQWIAMGATPQERWGANLNRYYEGLGWHAGPHLVVCPDYVWMLSELGQPGVSVSCWNAKTIGVEMVGNYEIGGDQFDSGLGANVRDNAVQALALLADLFGWNNLSDYVAGEKGLHFHRECTRDHHACPGSKVDKADIIARIEQVRGVANMTSPVPSDSGSSAATGVAKVDQGDPCIKTIQLELNAIEPVAGLQPDGILGPETRAAVVAFQKRHSLVDDWQPGSRTRALLSSLASHAD